MNDGIPNRSGMGVCRFILFLLLISRGPSSLGQNITFQYFYDDLGRLVAVVDQSGNVVTYKYDAVGNILSISRSTISAGSLAIFDFNPQRGPAGMAVTIRGQGFSATASLNAVKFNGTAAAVISASTSTLVASVPPGATTGLISVTVGTATATSSTKFVVVPLPVITGVWPKSALFGVVIPNAHVTGANLIDATFSFSPAGPTTDLVSVDPTGTSATLSFSTGDTAGTFALVATNPYGAGSGKLATAANRFTVVDPASTGISACGIADVIEAAFGLDPLDPNSCATSSSIPLLGGGADAMLFSVLNTAPPKGSPTALMESDGVPFFSVLNTAPPPGSPSALMESDGTPFFSILNTTPRAGSASALMEADGIIFSVQSFPLVNPLKPEDPSRGPGVGNGDPSPKAVKQQQGQSQP